MSRFSPHSVSRWLAIYVRWERWIISVLVGLLLLSAAVLLWRFYRASTLLIPATGGTYIEGSIGDLQPLNPWFTMTNDVNRDIVSLVFSGLLKYNPETKEIEDDLATYTVSRDGKLYTVELKKDLFWHDSTEENPHPVTADDVVFTFTALQDQEFPNSLLRQNFQGVHIEALDERKVQFRLDEPYGFFPSNLTLGLLPKKSFEGLPVNMLDQTVDFGFQPVGAGPYRLKSVSTTELSTEVTLERWKRSIPPVFRLDRIVFRMFPNYSTLLSDIRNLDGIRLVPRTESGEPAVPRRFTAVQYSLPQYVALFFNMDRRVLGDRKLRLGLQLGTNKQQIIDAIGESTIVDTPLLEIASDDWRYAFDLQAAQGALFESEWYYPEKVHLQRLLEQREANLNGALHVEPVLFLDTGAFLTITGTEPGLSGKNTVNGVPLEPNPTASGSWMVVLPTEGTGSIQVGTTILRLLDAEKKAIDSCYVRRFIDPVMYQRAVQEQKLVETFVLSREKKLPEQERITVQDLTLDKGFLRRRKGSDVTGVRINGNGDSLTLHLLTSPSPENYRAIAEIVRRQWADLGVRVILDIPETWTAFEEKLLKRDYDVLLFGQSLLDNLDSYPYWHSSGVQKVTGKRNDLRLDAYNLSQYASFEADALLETIRGKYTDEERQEALRKLQDILKRDVPAVFLYSPSYTFAHREDILGIGLGHLSLHSDRFLTLNRWYIRQERVFQAGKSWLSFVPWLFGFFTQESASEASPSQNLINTGALIDGIH